MEEQDRSKIFSQLDQFEKKLKANTASNMGVHQSPSGQKQVKQYVDESSSDQEPSEIERLTAMRETLINKLYHKDKEIKELKEALELVQTRGDADAKEKKIIELAKKVRNLNLQLENYKNKAAKAIEHVLEIEKTSAGPQGEETKQMKETIVAENAEQGGGEDLRKKLKDADKRIAKLRNENVALKSDYEKACRALQKEIGESSKLNIDEIIKNPESGWKGRAQQINLLKARLKGAPDVTHASGFATPLSEQKAEQNLGKLGSNKAKQIEQLSQELAATTHELKELKLKYSAAVSRRNTLEGEVKGMKTDYALKMKVLLEKTDNDDKLIKALKEELRGKGGSSPAKQTLGKSDQDYSKILLQNANLRSENKLLDQKLKIKENELQDLFGQRMTAYSGKKEKLPPVKQEESKLIEALQNEISDLKQRLKRKPKEESDLMIKDLTKQNLNFRKKIDDLQMKLAQYQK